MPDTKAKSIFEPKPNEFRVSIEVIGCTWRTITADSAEQARKIAEAIAKKLEGEHTEVDHVESAEVGGVHNPIKLVSVTDETEN